MQTPFAALAFSASLFVLPLPAPARALGLADIAGKERREVMEGEVCCVTGVVTAVSLSPDTPGEVKEAVATAQEILMSAKADIRETVLNLRNDELFGKSPEEVLKSVAKRINGRDFHKVAWNGRLDWVDKIYNREDLSQVDIPPVFKKRGWAYEREIRLVVELAGDAPEFPQRLGISFDEPLAELERHMRMTQKEREETAMDSKWTPCIKIWDRRFPMLQSGPWFDEARASDKAICGFKLKDAHKSEYENEIRMFDLISGKDCGCSA